MERRFDHSFYGFLFSGLVRFALLSALVGGCAGSGRTVAPTFAAETSQFPLLLERARELAEGGQSSRAEEYYLAALEAGADEDIVYPELIDTCIEGGRLGSAMVHVDRRLQGEPENPRLLRLSASLSEALGQERKAWERVNRLEEASDTSAGDDLFLAGFYERRGDGEQALLRYERYFERTPSERRESWVASKIRQLGREELGSFAKAQEEATEVSDD